MKYLIMLIFVVLLVCGCSNATKKTEMSLPQTVDLTFSVPIEVSKDTEELEKTPVTVHIEQKVTLSGLDLITDTEQTPTADGKMALPVGMGGSAPTANVAGELGQGDITANQEKDDSLENVGNPQDNSTDNSVDNSTGGAVVPVVPADNNGTSEDTSTVTGADPATDVDLLDYSFETHDLKHLHDDPTRKLYRWMDHTGAYYGKNIIVKFSDGDTWLINDGGQQQGGDGNTSNHEQKFWFSGNPEQQKDTNMGCDGGCASIFPEPDSKAETVTLYYKK